MGPLSKRCCLKLDPGVRISPCDEAQVSKVFAVAAVVDVVVGVDVVGANVVAVAGDKMVSLKRSTCR